MFDTDPGVECNTLSNSTSDVENFRRGVIVSHPNLYHGICCSIGGPNISLWYEIDGRRVPPSEDQHSNTDYYAIPDKNSMCLFLRSLSNQTVRVCAVKILGSLFTTLCGQDYLILEGNVTIAVLLIRFHSWSDPLVYLQN